jgi:hypothetical protein
VAACGGIGRLALASQRQLPYADFLELVLADEVTRHDGEQAAAA